MSCTTLPWNLRGKLREIYGPMVLHQGLGRVAWSNQTEIAVQVVGTLTGQPAAHPDAQTVKATVLDLQGMKETVLCRVDSSLGGLRPVAFSPDGRDLAVRVSTTESLWSRPSRVLWGERYIQLYDAGGRTQRPVPWRHRCTVRPRWHQLGYSR